MVCIYKNASASSPRPLAGALPLDPTGGLCPPDPLIHFAVPPQYFPKAYAYGHAYKLYKPSCVNSTRENCQCMELFSFYHQV